MSGVDEHGITLLREAWEALGRQAETTAACGAADPRARRLNETFARGLQKVAASSGWLCLRFDGRRVLYRGRVVGESATWARLSALGVRSVVVEEADRTDLGLIGDLLARDWSVRDAFEQDLSRAQWRLGLRSCWIDVRAPARDDSLDQVEVDLVRLVALTRSLDGEGLPTMAPFPLSTSGGELLDRYRRDLAFEAPEMDESNALAELQSTEQGALAQEVATVCADADIAVDSVGRVGFELLRLLEGEDQARAARRLGELALRSLQTQDAEGTSDLLRRAALLPDATRSGLASLVADPAALAAALDAVPADQAAKVLGALLALPSSSVPELCGVAAHSTLQIWRQTVADAVVLLLDDPAALRTLFESSEGRDQVAPLLGLARQPSAATIDACLRLTEHADGVLRGAALTALRPHNASERVQKVVLRSLTDNSRLVRVEALRQVAVHAMEGAAGIVEEQLRTGALFARSDAIEARAWLMAYARAGGVASAPLLLGLLDGSARLPATPTEWLPAAVRAALATGDPSVSSALEALAKSQIEVRRALAALRKERAGP